MLCCNKKRQKVEEYADINQLEFPDIELDDNFDNIPVQQFDEKFDEFIQNDAKDVPEQLLNKLYNNKELLISSGDNIKPQTNSVNMQIKDADIKQLHNQQITLNSLQVSANEEIKSMLTQSQPKQVQQENIQVEPDFLKKYYQQDQHQEMLQKSNRIREDRKLAIQTDLQDLELSEDADLQEQQLKQQIYLDLLQFKQQSFLDNYMNTQYVQTTFVPSLNKSTYQIKRELTQLTQSTGLKTTSQNPDLEILQFQKQLMIVIQELSKLQFLQVSKNNFNQFLQQEHDKLQLQTKEQLLEYFIVTQFNDYIVQFAYFLQLEENQVNKLLNIKNNFKTLLLIYAVLYKFKNQITQFTNNIDTMEFNEKFNQIQNEQYILSSRCVVLNKHLRILLQKEFDATVEPIINADTEKTYQQFTFTRSQCLAQII